MSLFLTRLNENGIREKFENIIKRINLICTHLITILHKSESDFENINRNIKAAAELVSRFNLFKYSVKGLLEKVASLLAFVKEREEYAKMITEELNRLKAEFGISESLSEYTVKRHHEEILEILQRENGEIELLKHFHEEFISIQNGIIIKLYAAVKEDRNAFPEEHQHFIDEFLYYLRKLVHAFYQLIKLIAKVEKLEGREAADFGYLNTLLDVKQPQAHEQTEIQTTISRLEQEFGL